MVAGAVFGQRLLAVAGDDLDLDAGLAGRLLDGFGDRRHRLRVAHVHGDGEAVLQPRLFQQFLGLGHVELERVLVQLAQHALGQEGLVDLADALDEGGADGVVVDQILERLAHVRLGQVLVLLVQADIVDSALRRAGGDDALVLGHGIEIVGIEVAGHVDVAGFQRQPLAGAFLHVAVDDAGELGLLAVVIVVALHHDNLVGPPFAQLELAGAGRIGLQPVIAEIVVVFVVVARRHRLDVLQHQLLVHHRADRGRQAVQHEARRIGLVHREDEGGFVSRLGLFRDVVAGQPELAEDEGRALVQLDGALEGPRHVLGGEGVAGGEFEARPELEGVGQPVVGDRPALGQVALDLRGVGEIEPHQQVVGVGGDFRGGQLERFGRVHADNVVYREAFHQRVGRGRCMGGGACQ